VSKPQVADVFHMARCGEVRQIRHNREILHEYVLGDSSTVPAASDSPNKSQMDLFLQSLRKAEHTNLRADFYPTMFLLADPFVGWPRLSGTNDDHQLVWPVGKKLDIFSRIVERCWPVL